MSFSELPGSADRYLKLKFADGVGLSLLHIEAAGDILGFTSAFLVGPDVTRAAEAANGVSSWEQAKFIVGQMFKEELKLSDFRASLIRWKHKKLLRQLELEGDLPENKRIELLTAVTPMAPSCAPHNSSLSAEDHLDLLFPADADGKTFQLGYNQIVDEAAGDLAGFNRRFLGNTDDSALTRARALTNGSFMEQANFLMRQWLKNDMNKGELIKLLSKWKPELATRLDRRGIKQT